MSTRSCIYTGLTLEFKKDINSEDYRKHDDFVAKYPELDEYLHEEFEGKLLLICDGMSGDFIRLIKVDKFIDGGILGNGNEFIELPTPGQFSPELIGKMSDLYEEYIGVKPDPNEFKYAMWSQWS